MMVHTNDCGFQVNKDGPGNVLPSPGLTEEGCEGVIVASSGLGARHLTIRLDTMFQAVEFPAGVPHLYTSLAHVDGDAFTLKDKREINLRSGWLYSFGTIFAFISMPGSKALLLGQSELCMVATSGLDIFGFRS